MDDNIKEAQAKIDAARAQIIERNKALVKKANTIWRVIIGLGIFANCNLLYWSIKSVEVLTIIWSVVNFIIFLTIIQNRKLIHNAYLIALRDIEGFNNDKRR